ncbi:hypothetical protein B566_EDAN006854 [Ephemera danica]|nr:hypothetical protein B566_EDAN006854 [Ephemera danica]
MVDWSLESLVMYTGAARAVGNAMALNPLHILVPCHRVLKNYKTNRYSVGKYISGPEIKQWLLEHEGHPPEMLLSTELQCSKVLVQAEVDSGIPINRIAIGGEKVGWFWPSSMFMAHGEQDSLIPCSWGRTTFEQLTALKYNGS